VIKFLHDLNDWLASSEYFVAEWEVGGLPLRPSFASFSSCLIMINKKLLLMSDVM
jgi:hypothetical protein